MGYIEELRAIIGHRLVILNGSVVVISDGAGRILLQHRVYPQGKYGFPGGLMELGESTEEAARREVYEETGLTLGTLRLLGVYSGKGYRCHAANGDEYDVVCTAYWTDEYQGTPCVHDRESVSIEWYAPEDLPENLARTHRAILDDYLKIGMTTLRTDATRCAPTKEVFP